MFCQNCGKEIADKAVICVHCGCSTGTAVAGEKSFVTVLLLCIFVGALGVHRFYTGHTSSAIAQLLLTLTFFGAVITGIWVLIDLISIITGGFKTASGETLIR